MERPSALKTTLSIGLLLIGAVNPISLWASDQSESAALSGSGASPILESVSEPISEKNSWAHRWGIRFQPQSLKIVSVRQASCAHVVAPNRGGIQPGDEVLAVNGKRMSHPQEFETFGDQLVHLGKRWVLKVSRGGQEFDAIPDAQSNPVNLSDCGSKIPPSPSR